MCLVYSSKSTDISYKDTIKSGKFSLNLDWVFCCFVRFLLFSLLFSSFFLYLLFGTEIVTKHDLITLNYLMNILFIMKLMLYTIVRKVNLGISHAIQH